MSKTRKNYPEWMVDENKEWKQFSKSWKKSGKKETNRNIRHAAKQSCEIVKIDRSAERQALRAKAEYCRQMAISYLKESARLNKLATATKDEELIVDNCVISKQRFWLD